MFLTVKSLRRGLGKTWAAKADDGRLSVEILAWHAAAELASFVEMTMEPGDLPKVAPATYEVLWGLEAYFKDIGQLPPHELAHLMLMLARVNSGLSARGEETQKPQ